MKHWRRDPIHFAQVAGGLPIIRIGTFRTLSPPSLIDTAKDLLVLPSNGQVLERSREGRPEALDRRPRRVVFRLLVVKYVEPQHFPHVLERALVIGVFGR